MMSVQCNSVPRLPHRLNKTTAWHKFTPLISNIRPLSTPINPAFITSNSQKLSNKGHLSVLAGIEEVTVVKQQRLTCLLFRVAESSCSGTDVFKLTYLEVNSWLWEVGGVKILVDPILVGNLNFGIPLLYEASKKYTKNFQVSDLPEVDCLLITRSLDDHCHLKTLISLSQKSPNLKVIATPDAKKLLDPLFTNVIYLKPGQNSEIETSNGSLVKVRAIIGPGGGLPWQDSENGYIVTSPQGQLSLYYEPHCVYDTDIIGKEKADIVITPVIKQLLPSFTLVSGQEDAVRLAKLLSSKFVVPMNNGDLDSKGVIASLIRPEGTVESFKELLLKELPDVKILDRIPGVPLHISPS